MGDTARVSHGHLLSWMMHQEPITDYTPAKIYYSKGYEERDNRKMKRIHTLVPASSSFPARLHRPYFL